MTYPELSQRTTNDNWEGQALLFLSVWTPTPGGGYLKHLEMLKSEIILASLCTWRKEEEYLVMQDNWIWCERWKAKGKKRKPWMGWMGNVKRTLHIRRMSVEQGDWWSIRNERWCSQHDYDRSSHAFGPISNDWFRCGEEDWIHYDIAKVNQCCCSTLMQNNPGCTEYWPHSVVSGHWSPLP